MWAGASSPFAHLQILPLAMTNRIVASTKTRRQISKKLPPLGQKYSANPSGKSPTNTSVSTDERRANSRRRWEAWTAPCKQIGLVADGEVGGPGAPVGAKFREKQLLRDDGGNKPSPGESKKP